MVANYYGGWSHNDDIELVEIVLKNVRNGKGVIDGCYEYEKMTNGKRTASASKYRFHTQLKEKYQKAYEMARMEGRKVKAEKNKHVSKRERLEKVVTNFIANPEVSEPKELTLDDVMIVMNQFKKQEQNKKASEMEVEKVIKENETLKQRNAQLVAEVKELEELLKDNTERQKQIVSALKILESAGINLNVPDTKYTVNKDGTIKKL